MAGQNRAVAGEFRARLGRTEQCKAGQGSDKAVQGSTREEQDRAVAGEGRARQGRAEQCKAGQGRLYCIVFPLL